MLALMATRVATMAAVTVLCLDDQVKERLRMRPAVHGRSMEPQIRPILWTRSASPATGMACSARSWIGSHVRSRTCCSYRAAQRAGVPAAAGCGCVAGPDFPVPNRIPVASGPKSVSAITASSTGTTVTVRAKL
jgi:hypothetical protein